MITNKLHYSCISTIGLILISGLLNNSFSQSQPGSASPPVLQKSDIQMDQGITTFQATETMNVDDEVTFHTTVFTFNEIVIFSYSNDTDITIVNTQGDTTLVETLQKDEYHVHQSSSGVYRIFGSKSFTALVGDATSNIVHGWYAVDQSGRGTSTLFNTYMMRSWTGHEQFIVAAYENNTEFSIRDLDTGTLLHAGVLNAGQFFTMPDTPFDKFLQVAASKPVSALSYGDTDYYVPSSNGTFIGTLFLGYSAYIGSWTNSITVTGYHDDTDVVVINTVTQDTIATYTLNEGQVHSTGITAPTYWRVESDKPVIAANIPYAGWTGNYFYKTRAIDSNGIGAGTLFYMPTIGSRIDVFSFGDQNSVKIERLGRDTDYPYSDTLLVFEGTLDAGEGYNFTSTSGRYVYKIQGETDVSVIQSNGGAGAEFMALSFAQELPDLAVSSDGIQFDPEKDIYEQGESINVMVRVDNFGPINAENVEVHVYDGDPDGEGIAPLLHNETIPLIEGNSFENISFVYTVPDSPEFRQLVVKVDPNDLIQESNSANNKAFRFIEPNEDLLPPIAVTVEATGALGLDENDELIPNPFMVTVTLLNTGEGEAHNVEVEFQVLDGLSIVVEPEDLSIESILPGESKILQLELMASPDVPGANRYSIIVDGSNIELKQVNRAVFVPEPASLEVLLISPKDGSELVDLPVIFFWKAVENADDYELQVALDDDFEQILDLEEGNHHNSAKINPDEALQPFLDQEKKWNISQKVKILDYGTEYFWRVRAVISENDDILSETWNFQTVNAPISTPVTLVSPEKDAEEVQIPAVLQWDEFSDFTSYELEISKTDKFVDKRIVAEIEEATLTLDDLADTTGYFWRVRAVVNDQKSAWSEIWNFITELRVPEIPEWEPGIDETDVELSPLMVWSASKRADLYDLQLANDPAFSALIIEEKEIANTQYQVPLELDEGATYYWRVRAGNKSGYSDWSSILHFTTIQPTSSPEDELPVKYTLGQNYPNPFNPTTQIRYTIPEPAHVHLGVYNILGELISVIVNEQQQAGWYNVTFDAAGLSSGIYIIRMASGSNVITRKMGVLK